MSKLRSTIYLHDSKSASRTNKSPFKSKHNKSFATPTKFSQSKILHSIKCQTEVSEGYQQEKDHLYHK